MATATATKLNRVNGIDVDALRATIRDIEEDPAKGMVEFRVTSRLEGPDPQRDDRRLVHASAARR